MRTIQARFGLWFNILKSEFDKDYFKQIAAKVSKRRKEVEVFPISDKVFRAFELTDPNKIRVVWIGQDCYPQWSAFTDAPIADGLAFSTNNNDRTPVSLFKIQKGIEDDCYEGFRLNKDNDLQFLCKQGVLLLNSSLTVDKNSPNSHKDFGWDEFLKFPLQYLIDQDYPIVFITFGVSAKNLLANLMWKLDRQHLVLNLEHPAASAYQGREWEHQNAFSKCNDFLELHYGKFERIKWLL